MSLKALSRASLCPTGAFALFVLWCLSCSSQETVDPQSEVHAASRPEVDRAIESGLRFLRSSQVATGSFSKEYPVAITALAGMAFLGAGVEYNRGEYGQTLSSAVQYLISKSQSNRGYINDADGDRGSRMHGHCYGVQFLAQVVGTIDHSETEARVRRAIEEGVSVIEGGQTDRGGWGYEPGDLSDEASITVCALQALRAAKDAGFKVQEKSIRGALRYLKNSAKEDGSFMYSLSMSNTRSSYELTAAAVSTLHAAGEYANEQHKKGVDYMRRALERYGNKPLDASTMFRDYGNFYAGQVFYQIGGKDWSSWEPAARQQLLSEQNARDGSWPSERFPVEYATAMALLILEIPRGFLPIFER